MRLGGLFSSFMIRKFSADLLVSADSADLIYRPELHAQPNPLDNSVEAHNAWVVGNLTDLTSPAARLTSQQSDGVTQYIDWATKHGFGVMDANVPSYITKPEVSRRRFLS